MVQELVDGGCTRAGERNANVLSVLFRETNKRIAIEMECVAVVELPPGSFVPAIGFKIGNGDIDGATRGTCPSIANHRMLDQ
jgi:hypothetical protein